MKNLQGAYAVAILSLFFLAFLSISCCDEDSKSSEDVFIFGHFYGECQGEQCVETFRLSSDKVFEDQEDSYGQNDFDFKELSADDFLQVKDLPMEFPEQLWNETETVLGCPDCADGGGIYIEYKMGSRSGKWRMETGYDDESEYAYLNDFIVEVRAAIARLN